MGVLDCWRQWWIGDTVQNMPLLQNSKASDLAHLDKIPLSAEEMHGRAGKHQAKHCPTRKIYSDMAFLMNYITKKVVANGAMADVITVSSVDAMYMGLSEEFGGGTWNARRSGIQLLMKFERKPKEAKVDTCLFQGKLRRVAFFRQPGWWWATSD